VAFHPPPPPPSGLRRGQRRACEWVVGRKRKERSSSRVEVALVYWRGWLAYSIVASGSGEARSGTRVRRGSTARRPPRHRRGTERKKGLVPTLTPPPGLQGPKQANMSSQRKKWRSDILLLSFLLFLSPVHTGVTRRVERWVFWVGGYWLQRALWICSCGFCGCELRC
jgi:hypothetical protein